MGLSKQFVIDLLLLSLDLSLHQPSLFEELLTALILCRVFFMFFKHYLTCFRDLLQVLTSLHLFPCVFEVGVLVDLVLESFHDHRLLLVVQVSLEISCEGVLLWAKVRANLLLVRFELPLTSVSGLFHLDFQEESCFFSVSLFLFLLILNIHQVRVVGLELIVSVSLLLLILR